MGKYKVQMVDKYSRVVLEDYVDDMVFDTEEDAEEHASYCNSCASQGEEILKMSNPGEYEEDYGEVDYKYVVAEIE